MLTRFEINNYRGFPSYKMDGLAHVNLLVGKNNSGKSALLEGIQLLYSGGAPGVLEEAAQRRGEMIVVRPDQAMIDPSHFFHGHTLSPQSTFSVAGDNGHPPVHVRIAAAKPGRKDDDDSGDDDTSDSRAVLRIDGGRTPNGQSRSFRLTREGGVDLDRTRHGLTRPFEGPPVRFMGTDSISTTALAVMWDQIQVSGLEDEVRDALRVLEPSTSSVSLLTGMFSYGLQPSKAGVVVGLGANKQRVPLGSMGDGMRRMLALATSLACTRGGALFADEIDTGLHYSVMADMWNLVVQRAVASDTQVFATTHSWDCIEGLSQLCQRQPQWLDKVAIHTIDRELQHSVAFKGDSIVRMTRHQIDPR